MSFDLIDSRGDDFSLASGTWRWMLEQGVGLPFSCGPSFLVTRFVFDDARGPGSPMTNDGYPVTAAEATAAALVARGLAAIYRQAQASHDAMSEERRVDALRDPRTRRPVPEDQLDLLCRFADWAEASGGFKIR